MLVFVKLFSNLRRYVDDIPPIGEPLELNLEEGAEVKDAVNKLGIPLDDIAIIMINHTHQSLDTKLHDGISVSLFPLSGGG